MDSLPHAPPAPPETLRIEVNLHECLARAIRGTMVVRMMRIKGGRPHHPTHTGHFHVVDRDEHHSSTIYGTVKK